MVLQESSDIWFASVVGGVIGALISKYMNRPSKKGLVFLIIILLIIFVLIVLTKYFDKII